MGFSEAQKKAICHRDGPMLVLAGPGSGKTTVITHRVRFLTEACGISPADILVITFTRAAATEMKERYESLIGHPSNVAFGTFHSVFFRILKLAYRYTADNIVREEQQQNFLRELLEKEGLEPEDENEFISWANEEHDDFLRFKAPEINKTAVKNALKSGAEIPFASLTRSQSLTIK